MVLYDLFSPLYLRMLLNEGLDDTWVDRLSGFVLAGCLAAGRKLEGRGTAG